MAVDKKCLYSDSCFTCPLKDCIAHGDITALNRIDWDLNHYKRATKEEMDERKKEKS